MQNIEHVYDSGQAVMDPPADDDQVDEGLMIFDPQPTEKPEITTLLRRLRGSRTLRGVEADTGISNAYLSNIESGAKRPGPRILSKLAPYYHVPLGDLLQAAGLPFDLNAEVLTKSVADLQRSYDFVISDPEFNHFRKPAGIPSADFQTFLVRMYEHYTGKKLL